MRVMAEDRVKLFTQSILYTSRSAAGLKDKFLSDLLFSSLEKYIYSFISLDKQNVAQSEAREIQSRIDSLMEWLEAIVHYKLSDSVSPLLAKKALLEVAALIKKRTKKEIKKEKAQEEEIKFMALAINGVLKEKILNHISSNPNIRSNELTKAFSDVSERTVQRVVKELVQAGVVERIQGPGKAVLYIKR